MVTALPCVVLRALWGLFTVVFDSVDWVWHHQLAAAASMLLIVLLMVTAVCGALASHGRPGVPTIWGRACLLSMVPLGW